MRAILQAISVVLLARAFGAGGYGALSGAMALYIITAQFVGFGTGISLLRHLSRGGQVHAKLRATQRIYLLTGLAFCLAAWPLSSWLFGSHLTPFALANLAFAELVAAPALLPLVYRYQATEQLSVSGGLLTVAPVARCVAILAATLLPVPSMDAFAVMYVASLVVAVGLALWLLWPRGETLLQPQMTSAAIREGLPFAVSGATAVANGELDKAMMLRFAGEQITGQYTAATRVVQATLLPVYSLVLAVVPRLFRNARQRNVVSVNANLFVATLAYSALAAIAIWALAPYLPWLLGADFDPSVEVLRLLTAAIITGSARQLIVMLLTTSDLQGARNRIEVSAILLALGTMLVLIPRYSSTGAIVALVASDLFTLALGLRALMRHDNHIGSRGHS